MQFCEGGIGKCSWTVALITILPTYRSDVQRLPASSETVIVIVVEIVAVVLVHHLVRHQWLVRTVAMTDMRWDGMGCDIFPGSQSALALSGVLCKKMIRIISGPDLSLSRIGYQCKAGHQSSGDEKFVEH